MNSMSVETFERVKEVVEPVLVHFKNDLYKHDLKTLSDYHGPFEYGFRRTGTDLLPMRSSVEDYTWLKPFTIEEMEIQLKKLFVWIDCNDRNTHFLYFDGQQLHTKTVQQLGIIWFVHIS